MEQNDCLFILSESFTETRDASVRLPKGEKKTPQKTTTKKPLAFRSFKCIDFFSVRASLFGGTNRSESKERRGEVPWEKTWIFFFF